MKRSIIFRNQYIHIFLIPFFLQSCLPVQGTIPKNIHIQHIVICWLKDPGNIRARQQLIDDSKRLSEIPGVTHLSVGSVLPSDRPIVDSSFDVALVVTFSDVNDMKKYLTHPIHLKLLKETVQPLTRKVLVYDFTGEKHIGN